MLRKTILAASGAALLAGLAAPPAWARDYTINSIHIAAPWSRATAAAGMSAVGYMTITNEGSTPDRLLSAACPVATSTELHSDTNVGGVMRMRPINDIPIAPGQTVKLTPGGMHLMLTGTTKRLARGSTITCTMTFQNAGPVEIELLVRSARATETLMGPMEQ